MRSTKDVIENHIGRFRGGDLEGILDDYSHEAMLFTPAGLLRGRSEIEALFKNLLAEFGKPGASDTVHTEVFEGEYAYLVWSAETADSYSQTRNGYVSCAARKNSDAIFRRENQTKAVTWPTLPRSLVNLHNEFLAQVSCISLDMRTGNRE